MKFAPLVLGIVVFGVLMGLRPEFQSMGVRAVVAAVAFVALLLGARAAVRQ